MIESINAYIFWLRFNKPSNQVFAKPLRPMEVEATGSGLAFRRTGAHVSDPCLDIDFDLSNEIIVKRFLAKYFSINIAKEIHKPNKRLGRV